MMIMMKLSKREIFIAVAKETFSRARIFRRLQPAHLRCRIRTLRCVFDARGRLPSRSLEMPQARHALYTGVSPNLSALRSAARGDLAVPRTRLQLVNRAFCVASCSGHLEQSATAHSFCNYIFKNILETHLFSRSYFTD